MAKCTYSYMLKEYYEFVNCDKHQTNYCPIENVFKYYTSILYRYFSIKSKWHFNLTKTIFLQMNLTETVEAVFDTDVIFER